MNVTVPPFGVALDWLCTVAVNITVWPKTEGLTSDVREAKVESRSTLYI
jgi:hypothetical protein